MRTPADVTVTRADIGSPAARALIETLDPERAESLGGGHAALRRLPSATCTR
jgi:hypothetical protein